MAKIEMTDEIRAQLRGFLPTSLDHRHKFSPAFFSALPEEFRPSFSVRPMTKQERDIFLRTEEPEDRVEVMFSCIDKASNVWTADGAEVDFDRAYFDDLHYEAKAEIREAVLKLSCLLDGEKLGLK